MRKKLFLLALSVAALAGALTVPSEAAGNYSCPQCITYSDGSQCCRPCLCNSQGIPIACTHVICPPYH